MVTLRVALVVLWAAIALDYAAYDGAAARAAGRVLERTERLGAPGPAEKAENSPDRAAGPAASPSDTPAQPPPRHRSGHAEDAGGRTERPDTPTEDDRPRPPSSHAPSIN